MNESSVIFNEKKLDTKSVGNDNIDQRFKKENNSDKRNWDFNRSLYGRYYKYGWKNGSIK